MRNRSTLVVFESTRMSSSLRGLEDPVGVMAHELIPTPTVQPRSFFCNIHLTTRELGSSTGVRLRIFDTDKMEAFVFSETSTLR